MQIYVPKWTSVFAQYYKSNHILSSLLTFIHYYLIMTVKLPALLI